MRHHNCTHTYMASVQNKILIVDEYRFSKIYSALLDSDGLITTIASNAAEIADQLYSENIGMVITSHPVEKAVQDHIWRHDLPSLILSDTIDDDLIRFLQRCRHSICMIKPLDFSRLRDIARQSVDGTIRFEESLRFV